MDIYDVYSIIREAERDAYESRDKWNDSMSFSKDCYQTAFLVLHFISTAMFNFINKK